MGNEQVTRRDRLEAEVLNIGYEAEDKAIEAFRKSEAALCVANADAIFNALAEAIKAVRGGSAPNPLSVFISREIERLLATKTWVECVKYSLRDNLSEEDMASKDLNRIATSSWAEVWTDEYGLWCQVVMTLATFLRDAAALARRVGSLDAARRYMIAWRYVNRVDATDFDYLGARDAATVVKCVAEANDFLWADLALEGLKDESGKGGV